MVFGERAMRLVSRTACDLMEEQGRDVRPDGWWRYLATHFTHPGASHRERLKLASIGAVVWKTMAQSTGFGPWLRGMLLDRYKEHRLRQVFDKLFREALKGSAAHIRLFLECFYPEYTLRIKGQIEHVHKVTLEELVGGSMVAVPVQIAVPVAVPVVVPVSLPVAVPVPLEVPRHMEIRNSVN